MRGEPAAGSDGPPADDIAARDWAHRVLQAGPDAPAWIDADEARRRLLATGLLQARRQAWALKALCYEAWSIEPSRVVHGAAGLQCWSEAWPEDREIRAIARWVGGVAAIVQGRMADALEGLDEAADLFAALEQPHPAAETQVPKLVALSVLGRNEEAVACAEQALRVFERIGDLRAVAKIELNLGSMLQGQDRYAESARLYRSAAVRFARLRDREHSIMADIGLANALTWQFEFDEALRINARARMRATTHGYQVLVAHAMGAIGRIELIRGEHRAALSSLSEAVHLLETTGASPQRVLEADLSLADAYLAVNLLPEAVALYDKVGNEAEALAAPMERAWAILERSRAQARLGAVHAAHEGLATARSLFTDIDNQGHVALCDLTLAEIELHDGNPGEAMESALRAAQELQGTGLRAWQLESQRLQALAYLRTGALDQAGRLLEQTLRDAADLPDLESACHTALGELAWRRGHAVTARQHLEAVLDRADHLRRLMPGDDFRAGIAWDAETAHDTLVEISAADGDAWALLRAMERGRARALALAHLEPGALVHAESADGEVAQLQQRLNWARARWRDAVNEGDVEDLPKRVDAVHRLEADCLEAARRLRLARVRPADGPSTADLTLTETNDQQVIDASSVQAALAPSQALVAFHRDARGFTACVVTRAGVQVVRHEIHDLDTHLGGLQFQMEAVRFSGDGARNASVRERMAQHQDLLLARTRRHLQDLYQTIWAPLEPALEGIRQVVLLPHRDLHAVPFCALHDGEHWLVERFELHQAPSVALWLRAQAAPTRVWAEALAVGVGSTALPHVDREIDSVLKHFGGRVTALRDDNATLDAVQRLAGSCDVLHLACHGRFRLDNPEFSLLQLADGPLTPPDVRQISLRAGLVVLSACESGMGRTAAGDETFGLVRAFRLAGADQVLATRWAVDDEASARLMGRFYAALSSGQSAVRALQSAQAVAARSGEHPFHWAAFALHG
jgi:tetratricopeptide (TPR) repeat protein